ncbi:MAG: hypothetical protein SGILL_006458 [Bacillariaceae sp.]
MKLYFISSLLISNAFASGAPSKLRGSAAVPKRMLDNGNTNTTETSFPSEALSDFPSSSPSGTILPSEFPSFVATAAPSLPPTAVPSILNLNETESLAMVKNTTGFSSCQIPPPYLSGNNTCGLECVAIRSAKVAVVAAADEIPVVGDLLGGFIDEFWPEHSEDESQYLVNLLDYVLARTHKEIDGDLLKLTQSDYQTLVQDAQKLDLYMRNNEAPSTRVALLEGLLTSCRNMYNTIHDTFLSSDDFAYVDALVTLIGQIGTACIAIEATNAYFYEVTTNSTLSGESVRENQQKSDETVDDYTALMATATYQAQAARLKLISSDVNGKDYGHCDSKWVFHNNIGIITDDACPSIGGSDSTAEHSVSGKAHSVLTGYQCHEMFNEANLAAFSDISDVYRFYTNQTYTDNFLSASKEIPPSWQLLKSENMLLDSSSKENGVPTQIRLASSLFTNGDMDAHGEDKYYFAYWNDRFPLEISPTASEIYDMYSYFNQDAGAGQRDLDRITQIDVAVGSYLVIGYEVTVMMDGQESSYTFGSFENHSSYNQLETLSLGPDQRITGLGLQYCGDTFRHGYDACTSGGMAFQITTVDPSTGALDNSTAVETWNPFEYPIEDGWITAPMIAQSNSDSYVPHLMGMFAIGNVYTAWHRLPVWSYAGL